MLVSTDTNSFSVGTRRHGRTYRQLLIQGKHICVCMCVHVCFHARACMGMCTSVYFMPKSTQLASELIQWINEDKIVFDPFCKFQVRL